MTYGDGDGRVFTDFTNSDDVIGHELTHGVTQFTAGLDYSDEPGALNESVSDVFGATFHQWRRKQTVAQADWLVGPGSLAPSRCKRDTPACAIWPHPAPALPIAATVALPRLRSPRRSHENSGIPNHAFYLAATTIGGQAWEKAEKVWYAALTSDKARPSTDFGEFAELTRGAAKSLFPRDTNVYRGVDEAWTRVGIPDSRHRGLSVVDPDQDSRGAAMGIATSSNDAAASPA